MLTLNKNPREESSLLPKYWGLEYELFQQLKNLTTFLLGVATGLVIFMFALRMRVIDFIKEDLGGKISGFRIVAENSNETITILDNKQKIDFITLFYLSLMRNSKSPTVLWSNKRRWYLVIFSTLLLAVILAFAFHLILNIEY